MLQAHNVPAPRPLYLDESGKLFDAPALVTGYLAGETMLSSSDSLHCARELAKTLALRRILGDQRGIAHTLVNLAHTAYMAGDYAAARPYLEEGLSIGQMLDDAWIVAGASSTLGLLALATGDPQTARAQLVESLVNAYTLESSWGMGEYLAGLAGVAGAEGDGERAAQLAGAARSLLHASGRELGADFQPLYDQGVAIAQAQLDTDQFSAAWSRGQTMTLAQMVADNSLHPRRKIKKD